MKSTRMKPKRKKSTGIKLRRMESTRVKSTKKRTTKKKTTGQKSAQTGMKAWLITWEGDEARLNGKCKVAAVLSAGMNKTEIKLGLRVLRSGEHTAEIQSLAYIVCRL